MLPLLTDTDVLGKRVFLRSDLDVPLLEMTIEDDTRLQAGLPTIQYLLEHGATVIVAGKLGRPDGVDKSLSLKPVAEWLVKKLQPNTYNLTPTTLGDFDGWRIADKLFLLENLRFYPGEEANDSQFAQKLASLADIYVNDSFAVSHRNHASIVGVPALLPHFAGLRMAKEVEVLGDVLENPKRPLVVVIGGAKVETKMPLITKMIETADTILVGGKLPLEPQVQAMHENKLIIATLTADGTDITAESVEKFSSAIEDAQTIVWNGPLGLIKEDTTDTEKGTREIALAIAKSNAYKIVGGGDTLDYLRRLGIIGQFDFVSMGGGAMLSFLSGEELPGLKALSLPSPVA